MNITLKAVKVHPDMSEETNCFSAEIHLDGRRVGYVKNDGRGGCHQYHWIDKDAGRRLQEWAEQQPTEFNFEKLDQLIDRLLEDYDYLRWLSRNTRKSVLFRIRGDKAGSWRTIRGPLSPAVRKFINDEHGARLEVIANESLEAAVRYCRTDRKASD